MIWNRVLGHEPQVRIFRRAVERHRLAHAYLFLGRRGIGKRLFARTLAQCLFCSRVPDELLEACGECPSCRQVQAGVHPDLIEVGLPEGKRELPISLIAGDRDARNREGLCHALSLTPLSAGRRVAILDDADALNEEAANALLKTLEEPPPSSLLILLSPEAELILPTIRSRCQPVNFSPLGQEPLESLLQQEGVSLPNHPLAPSLVGGSVETARQLAEPGLWPLCETVQGALTGKQVPGLATAARVLELLEELGSTPAIQRQGLAWVLQFAVQSLRQRLESSESPEEIDRLAAMLDRCFIAEDHLRQFMPVPLCVESLFVELGRRARV